MANYPFQNASTYIPVPSHDGSDQLTHPSIIDFFTEHNMTDWQGYRYWMAYTPYTNNNDEEEDPNVIASNDGQNWVVPNGLINPLDDAPKAGYPDGYNADTDMVYNPDTNELWVYYRYWNAVDTLELRLVKISADMTYTLPQAVITVSPYSQAEDLFRSQVIWRENSNKWHMWGQGGDHSVGPWQTGYSFSTDGINWSGFQQCFNSAGEDPFVSIGYENWHPSGKPNFQENKMEFITSAFPLGGVQGRDSVLLYAESPLDNPTLMNCPISELLLVTSGGWDDMLYRPTFVRKEVDGKNLYEIWYSAKDIETSEWHLGYTEGHIELESGEWRYISKLNSKDNEWSSLKDIYIKEDDGWKKIKSVMLKQ